MTQETKLTWSNQDHKDNQKTELNVINTKGVVWFSSCHKGARGRKSAQQTFLDYSMPPKYKLTYSRSYMFLEIFQIPIAVSSLLQ